MPNLQTTQLIKQFGKQVVLDDINLTLKPNTIYGLLGRNGVGKSTLLSILANHQTASLGEIKWGDTVLTGRDHPLQAIYLMSEINLFNKDDKLKTIIKNTALLQGSFDHALADEMLTAFDLNPKKKLNQLSTGYRTIFKTIVALCVPAEYVFLDEPVLGLDANYRSLLYRYILQAYESRPRTFVVATHIIEEIATLVEHVLVLNDAQLIVDDDLETVLAKSYRVSGPEELVREYCTDLNVLDSQQMGTLYTVYLYDVLPEERVIPDRLTIDHIDLQETFIKLTNKGSEAHV